MAARVNTRFVLVLTIMIVGVAACIVGLFAWRLKADASRNIRKGDELMAAGQLEQAWKYYGRAVHKEPGRIDYLRKLEEALLTMQPETSDEASNRYTDWIRVLRHEVQHHPTDPKPHLRLIDELHRAARLTNQTDQWAMLESAASEMWERLSPSEPERALAKVYRGVARMRQSRVMSREELAEAEQDLLVAVDTLPDNDLGWAALVTGQLTIAEQLQSIGQTRRADEKREQAFSTLRQAKEHVPDGPEVAKMALLMTLSRRAVDAEAVSDEELVAAADHLAAVMTPDLPAWAILEASEVLRRMWQFDGPARATVLLERYLADNPGADQARFFLARSLYRQRELDGSHEHAMQVIESEPLSVGLLSRMQFQLRKQAAGLIVDIEQVRWEQGSQDDREELIANIQTARDRLAAMVVDPSTDPILMLADGKLAFAKGDFRRAASKLEAIVSTRLNVEPEVRMYLATSLQRTGDVGRALEHMTAASQQRLSTGILYQKARLEYDIGRLDEAARTVDMLLQFQPDHKPAKRLASVIQMKARGEDVVPDDPIVQAVQAAQIASAEGDLDTARATLETVLEANPDSVPLIEALARIDLAAADNDAARRRLERALELQPNNPRIKGLLGSMDVDDPVDGLVAYYRAFYSGDSAFDVAVAVNMPVTVQSYRRRAEQLEAQGNAEEAAAAREIADRANRLAEEALARAKATDPDEPQLIEFEFMASLRAEDWATAERLAARAGELNLDQADGLLYRGRYELFRSRFREAVRTLEAATAEIPYSAVAWRSLGVAYQSLGNFPEAVRAFEESYLSNPNDVATVRQYVGLLDRTGEKQQALTILRSARSSFEDNAVIREAWLALEANVGNPAVALRERREAYQDDPEDRMNAARLAALLGRTDPTPEMILTDDGRPKYGAPAWSRLSRDRQQQIIDAEKDAWNSQSDEIIAALMEAQPGDLGLHKLKSRVLRGRGEIIEGERVLHDFIMGHDESERTAAMFIALGDYQAESNQYGDAEASYLAAREIQDDEIRQGDVALARLYFSTSSNEKAIEALTRVIEIDASRSTQLQLIEVYSRAGRYDDAARELQRVVEESGHGHMTKMLEAAIALGRGEQLYEEGKTAEAQQYFDEQRIALAEAQDLLPSSPLPQIVLAQSLLKEHFRTPRSGLLDDALLALERAEEIKAGMTEARMIRAEVAKAMGREGSAIGELTRLVEEAPTEDNARRSLMQYHVDQGNFEAAIGLARRGATESRSVAYWNEVLGDLLALRKQDYEGSAEAYATAFDLRQSLELLSKLADVRLAVDDPDYAGVLKLLESFPAERRQDPIVSYLMTKTLAGLNRRDDAKEMARAAFDQLRERVEAGMSPAQASTTFFLAVGALFPPEQAVEAEAFVMEVWEGQPDVFTLRDMATFWSSAGSSGTSRAIELQQRAIDAAAERQPDLQASLHAMMAQYRITSGDMQAAAASFARSIELNPNEPATLNNYAYMLAEHLDRPNDALPYAQKAAQLRPEDPSLLDTLGWVEFKMGDHEQAEQHLMESVRGAENAATLLHLAQVQVARDDLQRAMRNLVRAAELRPDPQTKAEIDRLADDIRTGESRDR